MKIRGAYLDRKVPWEVLEISEDTEGFAEDTKFSCTMKKSHFHSEDTVFANFCLFGLKCFRWIKSWIDWMYHQRDQDDLTIVSLKLVKFCTETNV